MAMFSSGVGVGSGGPSAAAIFGDGFFLLVVVSGVMVWLVKQKTRRRKKS